MDHVLNLLRQSFPGLTFRESTIFCWSPEHNEVQYVRTEDEPRATWSLLHETSHALLRHTSYKADFELLRLEVMAWERAKELGTELGIDIDENHVQDCLDSYRDWLYARSICPRCSNKSIQQANLKLYRCFNCHKTWQVSPSRFCRAYRAVQRAESTTSSIPSALQNL